VAIIALLSGGLLAGRDAPGVSGASAGPGIAFADQGDEALRPGQLRPVYDSEPPTSGPHIPTALPPDGSPLSDDQLLSALAVGDVVIAYPPGRVPPGLAALAAAAAPPDRPALAASGQAVILAPFYGVTGIVALAWAHMDPVASASDPALRTFVVDWLGRGATADTRGGHLPSS
jgi:hypothetical protein